MFAPCDKHLGKSDDAQPVPHFFFQLVPSKAVKTAGVCWKCSANSSPVSKGQMCIFIFTQQAATTSSLNVLDYYYYQVL